VNVTVARRQCIAIRFIEPVSIFPVRNETNTSAIESCELHTSEQGEEEKQ
jgi:hypothetical protein